MAQIEIRFFGRLADLFGRSRTLDCGAGGLTVGEIRDQLGGEVVDRSRVKAAIDETLAGDDARVPAGGSVDLLPPLSGG